MTIAQTFLAELQQESVSTRKMLERVPLEQGSWKPHEKSMTLMQLTQHVADIPSWISYTINEDELDFSKFTYNPPVPNNTSELLDQYDNNLKSAVDVLQKVNDDEMGKPWTMRNGETVYFTLPKGAVLRTFAFNHLVHHRGQLSVYLRLLNIPVPGAYGPSADEQ